MGCIFESTKTQAAQSTQHLATIITWLDAVSVNLNSITHAHTIENPQLIGVPDSGNV